jgi:hypothetical protein
MIQSVVDLSVYQIANQYFSENRVRIMQADETQITSAVFGISGVHEQTIRLSDGHLSTQCSCSQTNEQPLCRHAIAVLLEYYRWVQPKAQAQAQPRAQERKAEPPPVQTKPTSALDIRLSDVTVFIEWLQSGVRSLESGGDLSVPPRLEPGEVMGWVKALQVLDERRRTSEEKQSSLESDLQNRDSQLVRLSQQLQTSLQETKDAQTRYQDAQAKSQGLELELAALRTKLEKLADVAGQFERFNSQMRGLAGDLIKNASNIDHLAVSFQEVAATLQEFSPSRTRQSAA